MSQQMLHEVETCHCLDSLAVWTVDFDSATAVRGVVPDQGGDGHAIRASWYDLV